MAFGIIIMDCRAAVVVGDGSADSTAADDNPRSLLPFVVAPVIKLSINGSYNTVPTTVRMSFGCSSGCHFILYAELQQQTLGI